MHAPSELLASYAHLVAHGPSGVSGYPPLMQQCMALDYVAGMLADKAKPAERGSVWVALRAAKNALRDARLLSGDA